MAGTNVLKGGHVRVFLQADGISPSNGYDFMGAMQIGDAEEPQGTSSPIYQPSTSQRNKFDIVDEVEGAPELGTLPFQQPMDMLLRSTWWDLKQRACRFHLQAVIGRCSNPSDFNEWEGKILYSFARLTSFGHGVFNPSDPGDNAQVNESGELEFRRMIPIRPIRFSERADADVLAEVLDGLFYDTAQCGDCGPASDGCRAAYFLTAANGGSPGLSSQIIYTTDNFGSVGVIDIPTLGGLSGSRLAVVGSYLVVIAEATNSHHISALDDVKAGTASWTDVDDGYVEGPRAIYSASAMKTFLAGQGGYIYRLDDPTSGVDVVTDGSLTAQDLNDIHGRGAVVVAVGGNNAVLVSTNDGGSFSLVTGPASGIALNAIWVLDDNTWFVGAANGGLFYTVNGGRTWTQKALPGLTSITDIEFLEDPNAHGVVGYVAGQAGASARVYRTTDGGYSWHYRAPAIDKLPSVERVNGLAICGPNRVAAFGRVSAGGDGLLATAE